LLSSLSCLLLLRPPPTSTLFPYTTLFRSLLVEMATLSDHIDEQSGSGCSPHGGHRPARWTAAERGGDDGLAHPPHPPGAGPAGGDRKSTRLNSSHVSISYAVFCLKKKKHR